MKLKSEPVGVAAAVAAALIAIWNVFVLIFNIDPEVAAAVNIAIGAVVGAVQAVYIRGKVTPVQE